MKKTIMLTIAAAMLAPALLRADDGEADRGVARLSVINGDVSVRRGDSGDTVAAAVNAPLVVQDCVLTGPSSRAEIQFDYGNMMRLGADSDIRISELEYRRYQIQVAVGTTTFRVLRDIKADVEIATPSVSVRPMKKGVYRITVRDDGSSEITVRSGEAEIYTPNGSERLGSGRTMVARGTASNPEFQVVAAIPPDDWDRWNENRDRDLQRSRSYQYVSADVYGADELDSYGRWVDVAPYGTVWAPVVAAGWAPYRHGRWAWVDWYGWTWVSYDPWGWAPYHYGRWLYSAPYGWCWYPGGMHGRHHWSPALVAFFGWGSYGGFHTGIGFGWGNVGWVPLAPHDPFHRWWGRGYYGGGRTINNVTIVNNTNITNIYANARRADGITGMNANQFGRAHVTSANMVRPGPSDVSRAGLVRGQLPLAPSRASLAVSDRQAPAVQTRVAEGRQFFSHRQPAPVERVPFETQRTAVHEAARGAFGGAAATGSSRTAGDAGRGVSRQAGSTASGGPVVVQGATPAQSESRDSGRGWRRIEGGESSGGPATDAQAGRAATPQAAEPGRSSPAPASSGVRQAEERWRNSVNRGATPSAPAPNPSAVAPPANDSGHAATPAPPANSGRTAEQERWSRFGDRGGARATTPEQPAPTPAPRPQPTPSAEPGRGGDRGSWQRFGEPGRSNAPAVEAPRRTEPARQAEPARQNEPAKQERTAPADRGGRNDRRSDASDGWQRFNSSGAQAGRTWGEPAPAQASPRGSEPMARSRRASPGGGGQQAVRINPPIVRDRPSSGGGAPAGQAARAAAPSGGGGHSGGGSAPARSGGGNGGSNSGGNGGGGRSGRSR